MKKQWIVLSLLGVSSLFLNACNVFESFDTPSGDKQVLDKARACFDQGDYECAREYYNQLAGDADTRISELVLLSLQENSIFSLADLISSLGEGTGNGSSLAFMAGTLSQRQKYDAATRTTIQSAYASAAAISDSRLRGFTQFITSNAMLNSVLAISVGTNGSLEASDLVTNPTSCSTNTACLTGCTAPNATLADGTGTALTMSSSTGWSAAPNHDQLLGAADAVDAAASLMTGSASSGGLVATLNQLQSQLGVAASADCRRAVIKEVLFSN